MMRTVRTMSRAESASAMLEKSSIVCNELRQCPSQELIVSRGCKAQQILCLDKVSFLWAFALTQTSTFMVGSNLA